MEDGNYKLCSWNVFIGKREYYSAEVISGFGDNLPMLLDRHK